MASPSTRPNRFQLDLAGYRFLKDGRALKLEHQPMELLILLVKRKGELVCREEIASIFWGPDVFVDTDQSINRIVRKLRAALNDDADAPRFIETIVGKGYRFIGDIEVVDPRSRDAAATAGPRSRAAPSRVAAAIGLTLLAATAWVVWAVARVPALEAAVSPLTSSIGDERWPTFSPDGSRVAFAWNGEDRSNWDVYVKEVGSSSPAIQLTSDSADDTMPAWSPDGRQIAFERQRGNQFAIYLTSPTGGSERRLTDWLRARTRVTFSPPSWCPDGKFLVATDVDIDSQTSEVVLIPIESGGMQRLMSSALTAGNYLFPAVAPDGSALAYEQCNLVNICDVYVRALNSAHVLTGVPRRLTRDGHLARGLAWMPDGRSLIYADGLRLGLRRAQLSGGAVRRLELAGSGAMYPAVDPAGDRLAFTRTGWATHLWRFSHGGTAGPEPFLLSTLVERAPNFSRDGKLVFGSDRGGDGPQLWIANQDGSDPKAVTDPTGRNQGTAQWSPDCRRIAYAAQLEDGHRALYVIDTLDRSQRRLTASSSDEEMPAWSRDGKSLYFSSTRSGRSEVWQIAFPPSGQAHQVTTAGGFAARESLDGTTLYYTRADIPDGPVFARSLTGGTEREVVASAYRWDFELVEDGMYYVTRPDPSRFPETFELRVAEFSRHRDVLLNTFQSRDVIGLTVSPDRQMVLTSGVRVTDGDDLMLIQHYR